METNSFVGIYSLEYFKTSTEWDINTYTVEIMVEGLFDKEMFTDGFGVMGYKPLKVKGKILQNQDPSQIQATRMDLEVHTALGRFNLDGSWAGSSGHFIYDYYKNYPSIGSTYSGSPSISHYTMAETSGNFIGWRNIVTLERIQTGSTWDVIADIKIGDWD